MADYLSMNDIQSELSLDDYNQMQSIEDNASYKMKYNRKITSKTLKRTVTEDYSKTVDITPTSPLQLSDDVTFPRSFLQNIASITDVNDPINPIEVLMSQEPDFMRNMYNIYIMICDKNSYPEKAMETGQPISSGAEKTSGRDYLYTSPEINWSIIGMRADGIDIPQMKQTSSTIKIAGQTVSKILGKIETTNKASLTVSLDQSMFILDAMHQLSHDFFAKERKITDTISAIEGKEFYNAYGALPLHTIDSKINIIDIIVEYDADYLTFSEHSTKQERLSTKKADTRYFPNKANRMQRYTLHDCRFLGRENSLEFHTQADVMKATFPFVFRRVVRTAAMGLN